MGNQSVKKIIIGISGASGAVCGIELLKCLRMLEHVEAHLVISKAAKITICQETSYKVSEVIDLADQYYMVDDITAPVASGSHRTHGMIIAPCSVKTMSEISQGMTGNLLTRAADVILKERRRLVIMLRETPLHIGHIKNLVQLSEMGAVIAPPVPAFYAKPTSLEEMVHYTVGRVLDLFDLEVEELRRWEGIKNS